MKYYILRLSFKEGSLIPHPPKNVSHYIKMKAEITPTIQEASRFFYKHYSTNGRTMLTYNFENISKDIYDIQKVHEQYTID